MKYLLFSIKMLLVFTFIFALNELNANNIKIEGIVQDIENNKTLSNVNIFDKEYYNHLSRIKSIYPESSRNFKLLIKFNL